MDPALAITLKEFAHQLNQLDLDTYSKLITQVFECFVERCAAKQNNTSFKLEIDDDHDLDRFKCLLSSGDSFRPMVSFLFRLIDHISQAIIKPKVLYKELIDANVTQQRAELFVTSWRNNSAIIVDLLKVKSFGKFSQNLVDVDWKLKLLTEHSNLSTQSLPIGELNFELDNYRNELNHRHLLTLGFNHSELMQFYDSLENIQTKLDQLQK